MNRDSLEGRTALVTGAAGDIGGALVAALLSRGAFVVATDRDRDALTRLTQGRASPPELLSLQHDVTDEDRWIAVIESATGWRGGIDILFNNAGTEGSVAPIVELDTSAFRRVLEINVTGTFLGLKHVLPVMSAAGRGAVVNTASTAGLTGSPDMAAYIASKHAVVGLTRAAALEMAGSGIRVNCICPGSVGGAMTRRIAFGRKPQDVDASIGQMVGRVPLGRQGTPEEIAAVALFLASDEASFVTGAAYVADGGRTAL